MIGIVSVLSATSRMHSLRLTNHERTQAHNGLRSLSERMHATSHGFSGTPQTWAQAVLATYAPGGSFGNEFSIEGLTPASVGEAVGAISIGSDETASDSDLGVDLGMPRDLNGNGDASDPNVSESARLLPVILTLRWRGENGLQQLRHGFFLMGY